MILFRFPRFLLAFPVISCLLVGSITADPEEFVNTTELIKYWGYPVESYDVITEDGYILNMIRIPHGRYHDLNTSECARSPILLIHGIFNDASVFILNPPASSPALILADAGFDVFLPNSRGTTDSQRHVNISTKDVQFWRFTIDEMSRYDTPAAIDKALELSRAESLYLLGHSQGTTIGSMALTERPEYNKKIRAMFQLAPAGPNHQLRGFMRLLVAVFKAIRPAEIAYKWSLRSHEIGLNNHWLISRIVQIFCPSFIGEICRDFFFLTYGPPSRTFNASRFPFYVAHILASTSSWNIMHWEQMIERKRIDHFDITPFENQRRYGNSVAPPYNYSRINTDIYLFWSRNDWLAAPANIVYLNNNLRPGIIKVRRVQ